MRHHRVALACLGVRERLAGAHRDVLKRVLRIGLLEAGHDHVVHETGVARIGRSLHDDLGRAEGRRGQRQADQNPCSD
ncbi:MAG TPA: hypothetical protein VM824_02060, partial [Thermoleophilaceae bacterium]|nr:hypothetical protein [Thermoleophilaceae bacterium]